MYHYAWLAGFCENVHSEYLGRQGFPLSFLRPVTTQTSVGAIVRLPSNDL